MSMMWMKNLYSANSRGRIWGAGVWVDVIGRSKKVRFNTGLESSKTIRWADIQRKRVPVIRRRYTKSSKCKRRPSTGKNSKKVRVSGSQSSIVCSCNRPTYAQPAALWPSPDNVLRQGLTIFTVNALMLQRCTSTLDNGHRYLTPAVCVSSTRTSGRQLNAIKQP